MTYEDIFEYRGDTDLTKVAPVVGTYNPSSGRPVPLWAAEDIAEKCARGHLLPALGAVCKTCKFMDAVGHE
jgi:hypothetical protein